MQISRLFETVLILLRKEHISAGELAEHFNVSVRTIYRDIDVLSGAGIPVYTVKGRGGGIMLLPDFVLNRTFFSETEKRDIISALQSMSAVNNASADSVINKLGGLFKNDMPNWISVDFSGWGSDMSEKFDILKEAILTKRAVSFAYYNTSNERLVRTAEPHQLRFKHRAWYLWAYCLAKDAPRLFKLTRIRDVVLTDIRTVHTPEPLENSSPPAGVKLVIELPASCAYRAYDEFEDGNVIQNTDGSFRIELQVIADKWLIGYLLSFGSQLRIIEPEYIKAAVHREARLLLLSLENSFSN